jgi:hypothetical protein
VIQKRLPSLFGIVFLGLLVSSSIFAEEIDEFIMLDLEKAERPETSSKYQEIVVIGYVKDYVRGDNIELLIITPDGTEKKISTYATKKGEVYTLLHFTKESQIGIYKITLIYNEIERASTNFEMIEKP